MGKLKLALPEGLTRMAGKALLKAREHAPEGLLIAGLGTIGYGAYRLCKGTLKASEKVSEGKDKLESIESYHEVAKNGGDPNYTEEQYKKDVFETKKELALNVAKEYAPGAGFMALGTSCILCGHHIMSKRQLALVAAYKTVDEAFRGLRGKVEEKYGSEALRELENPKKGPDCTVKTVDSDGNESDVRHFTDMSDMKGVMYDRFFDDMNPFWTNDCHSNVSMLLNCQDYCNHKYGLWGSLDLNYAYTQTGFERSKDYGMIVGWNGSGDGYIDFGLRNADGSLTKEALDYIHGGDPHAPLRVRFNVDGVIFGKISKEDK